VAVQVDRLAVHAVPGAEGVMAQHEGGAVQGQFGIVADAVPVRRSLRRLRVVVADDQMLATVQPVQKLIDPAFGIADGEIAEMPDLVLRPDGFVPARDEMFVHFGDRVERAAIHEDHPMVAEMRVAGEKDRHHFLLLRNRNNRDGLPRALLS
jgi:hypothetical protein